MNGTVLIYETSLEVERPECLSLGCLKKFGLEAVEKTDLTLRRFSVENYKNPKNSYTVVMFLNESHLILTSYPEASILEFEIASCKKVSLSNLIAWIQTHEDYKVMTYFYLEKNENNLWQI